MPRPGRGGMSLEKSKDFKGAILRLLKSLSPSIYEFFLATVYLLEEFKISFNSSYFLTPVISLSL